MSVERHNGHRRCGGAADFFLVTLVAISFLNRIDVWIWSRLCTHFEDVKLMTFASVT